MPHTAIDYGTNGIQVLTPEPLHGAGGTFINDNLKAISDALDSRLSLSGGTLTNTLTIALGGLTVADDVNISGALNVSGSVGFDSLSVSNLDVSTAAYLPDTTLDHAYTNSIQSLAYDPRGDIGANATTIHAATITLDGLVSILAPLNQCCSSYDIIASVGTTGNLTVTYITSPNYAYALGGYFDSLAPAWVSPGPDYWMVLNTYNGHWYLHVYQGGMTDTTSVFDGGPTSSNPTPPKTGWTRVSGSIGTVSISATDCSNSLNASNLAAGTVPTSVLGSGTANSSSFLRGDNTWQTFPSKIRFGLVGTISTGYQRRWIADRAYTITGWTIVAVNGTSVGSSVTTSIVMDLKKQTYSAIPSTGTSIVASAPPTLSAGTKATSTTLTGWTTSISVGDYIDFIVTSVTQGSATEIMVILDIV